MPTRPSRRRFFQSALAAAPALSWIPASAEVQAPPARLDAALSLRQAAARNVTERGLPPMVANSDEAALPGYIGCFSKGLLRHEHGEVKAHAYEALLKALRTGKHEDFERIPRGGGRHLSNPEAAFAYHTEGADPHQFAIPPAPSLTSAEAAHEVKELYWQALCRDVPFAEYEKSPMIARAAADLGATPATVFRGKTKADLQGPYISQFLWKPIPCNSSMNHQCYRVPIPGSDFMTTLSEWDSLQSGLPPWRAATYEETPRYLLSGRDLAEYVHYDFPYQAYLNAALILVNAGPHSILNCNAFKSSNNPYRYSTIQDGFVTFGPAEVTDWLGRVTTAVLKASWCQKWMVHRRLRPEAFGGLVEFTKTGKRHYPVHADLLSAPCVEETFSKTHSYLLPQAYPEGCPLHPSYPAAHAAIAGACSVVLKVCFDEAMLLPGSVEPADDGRTLKPIENYAPTVGDEVNKLAYNISMARGWAGIHYRSDSDAGLRLGEDVAISVLRGLARTYTETYSGLSFTRLDGTRLHISPKGEVSQA